MGSAGISNTSALCFGGFDTADLALTESWNGTSWTEVADLNTARSTLAGAGIQTSALAFGGNLPGVTAATESWNGSKLDRHSRFKHCKNKYWWNRKQIILML
jgi:hypothetical protein